VIFGMTAEPGGLSGTSVVPLREYFTDDSIVIEGVVRAKHVGDVTGYPPTNQDIELAYTAFYTFDEAGKLVSERITMNWAPLALGLIPPA
jgi:hypothetical protein